MKPMYCTFKDSDYAMRCLTQNNPCDNCPHGANCHTMQWDPNTKTTRPFLRINAFDNFPVIENVMLPLMRMHCRKCNKTTGQFVAKLAGYPTTDKYVIQCRCCKSRWTMLVTDYQREYVGYTNANGDYVGPSKDGQNNVPKHVELKQRKKIDELRTRMGFAPQQKEEPEVIFKNGRLVINPNYKK